MSYGFQVNKSNGITVFKPYSVGIRVTDVVTLPTWFSEPTMSVDVPNFNEQLGLFTWSYIDKIAPGFKDPNVGINNISNLPHPVFPFSMINYNEVTKKLTVTKQTEDNNSSDNYSIVQFIFMHYK